MDAESCARQSPNAGQYPEEEIENVLQLLGTSLITPPSGSDFVAKQQIQQQRLIPEQLNQTVALQESEGVGYRELGEVIDLLGSLDANDSGSQQQQQRQQQQPQGAVYTSNAGARLNPGGELLHNTVGLSQPPRSAPASSNLNVVDNISPVGLLNASSMSPATINWLQTLVPSTSTDSLTSLISPATLYGAGSSSALGVGGGNLADGATSTRSEGLPRTPSCETIDWKAYNESCSDKPQKEPTKWRVIPQHGPHADPAANFGVSFSTSVKHPSMTSELSAQQQMQRKLAEEKNKRKAIVSPEYVQYGNPVSLSAAVTSQEPTNSVKIQASQVQYATKVPEPSGRRPFKKSLHHTARPAVELMLKQQQQEKKEQQHKSQPKKWQNQPHQQDFTTTPSRTSSVDEMDDTVRCRCTGKCRNARCTCVKAGLECGTQCKCVSCANPFVPMARQGIDIRLMARDTCLMQNLSKIKDMRKLLDSTASYECCEGGGLVQVKHTVENGYACPHCGAHFTYSWCNNRLCPDSKKPRRHCAKCRRCGDHRNQHCDLCNHCYFAGVANSFRCSCQSSGSGNGKTRAVVPNPVRRGSDSTTKHEKQNDPHLCGTVNSDVEGAAHDEKCGANHNSKPGDEEAVDSCKMQ